MVSITSFCTTKLLNPRGWSKEMYFTSTRNFVTRATNLQPPKMCHFDKKSLPRKNVTFSWYSGSPTIAFIKNFAFSYSILFGAVTLFDEVTQVQGLKGLVLVAKWRSGELTCRSDVSVAKWRLYSFFQYFSFIKILLAHKISM